MRQDLITVAIPIFNEDKGVFALVKKVTSLGINKEIIILDDGSTRLETRKILDRIEKKFSSVKLIRSKKNIGKANMIKKGIKQAKGNIFVILDGDSELDPFDISLLYRRLKESNAMMVSGIRVVKKKGTLETTTNKITRLAKKFFGLCARLFYKKEIKDVLSGYKMFYTKDFKKYNFSAKRFGMETELIVRTLENKGRLEEIDVSFFPRTYKEGKKINFFDGFEILRIILQNSERFKKGVVVFLATIIFFLSFFSFTFSMRFFPTTDSLPNNFTALNILFNRRIDLTNLKEVLSERDLLGTTITNSKGIIYSKTPTILGVLSLPTFFVFNKVYGVDNISPRQIVETSYNQYIGKLSASFYSALSSVILFLILIRVTKQLSLSLAATLVYCLGTNVFNIASQSNLQHGTSLLLINLFLLIFLANPNKNLNLLFSGLIGGLFSQVRLSNTFYLPFPLVFLFLAPKRKKETIKNYTIFLLGAGIAYLVILGIYRFLQVPSGYRDEIFFSIREWSPKIFGANFFSLLFSFNFGLFVFSPILILNLPLLLNFRRKLKMQEKRVFIALLPTLMLFVIFAPSWWMWTGGLSPGARLLLEAIPILIIFLAFSYKLLRKYIVYRLIFISLFVVSLYLNILTTYFFDTEWYDKYTIPGHRNQVRNAWFRKPTSLNFLIEKNYIHYAILYKRGDKILVRNIIYRLSLRYKGIVKLHDSESLVLKL